MFTLLMKKFIVSLMAIAAMLNLSGRTEWADSCEGHEFPRIAAEEQQYGATRIMSFNIRCADVKGVEVKNRLDIGVRQILEIMPDSLGVQETTPEWMKKLDSALWTYDWVGLEREAGDSPKKGGESCPIFYLKTKYRLVDHGDFWLSDTPDVPSLGPGAACKRICTWARLENRFTGKEYVHVNTHLDHVSEEARDAGAKIVVAFIEENFTDIPVVFTADINTYPDTPAYNTLTGLLADSRLNAPDSVDYLTFHGAAPETHGDSVIDFVLCSADIRPVAYRVVTQGVDGRFVSDHFPIYADVKLPGSDSFMNNVC